MKLSEKLLHRKNCTIFAICICNCYVSKVAQLEAENEGLREAVANTLMTPLGEPIGIVGRQVLHDALKE